MDIWLAAVDKLKELCLQATNPQFAEEVGKDADAYLISRGREKSRLWKEINEKACLIAECTNAELGQVMQVFGNEALSRAEEIYDEEEKKNAMVEEMKSEISRLKEVEKMYEEISLEIEKKDECLQREIEEKKRTECEIAGFKAEIEKLKSENQTLLFQNNELMIAVEQLQVENKSFLDKIITNTKVNADNSLNSLKSPSSRKEIIPIQPSKKQFMKNRIANSRDLTLKQLKDAIEEIYNSKVKFDEKCFETKQPRETMDQFLYTYLNQKYGLKSLIGEWSVLLLKSIEKFEEQDAEVQLFSKILSHKIDEEFRFTFEKLKENMRQILKAKIQQRNPYMREVLLNSTLKEKMNGVLDEDEWGTIIVSMFSQEEAEFIIGNIKTQIEEKANKLIIGRRNKMTMGKSDASYCEIQNAILKYDMSAHEALLEPFWSVFTEHDADRNGILTEEEFRALAEELSLGDETDRLLDQVDSTTTGFINYSDCVRLFTYEMLQNDSNSPVSVLHYLFFRSQQPSSS
jgi:hypothetical protein